ncbi:hypothetical protein CTEN210_17972 [Chaetoceros tenuissimus]|uniref:Leucine-rich repeat domain-containing protein n=1 Tax=Chaetoceros tenuissimus TaxID=426638 RepID=A0AAD3DBV5_9STRA|nr:hypothetical protein CTEN210_17972 [Chaetoceros tenuissimus]
MTRIQLSEEERQEIQKLGPGVRMYKDKKTLFWNGEKLQGPNRRIIEYLIYDKEERNSWEVITVLPGVEVIHADTFSECEKIKTVIMADDVNSIEMYAFYNCESLEFIRLSRSLDYIGFRAFDHCHSLTSIFIPDSCRVIDDEALCRCKKLIIFKVPHHTHLVRGTVNHTLLFRKSPNLPMSVPDREEFVRTWVKNLNQINTTTNVRIDKYAINRLCSSMDPSIDTLYNRYIRRFGLGVMKYRNKIGISPSQYLSENPYVDVDEQKLINRFILEKLGENF